MYDLLIAGGRIIDPSQNLDADQDIALADGRVAALARSIERSSAKNVVNAQGLIVVPGLIDLHVHVYEGVSHYGVNADATCLDRGVTTVVDTGSSGALTYPGLLKYVIQPSRTRILSYLNLSMIGMISNTVGELQDLRHIDAQATLETAAHQREILGIKLRMEAGLVGDNGHRVLGLAREVADAAGLPLMVHIGETQPPLDEILRTLQKGDILTHCFHSRPGGILDEEGRVLPTVRNAVARGIVLDVGHGRGSFSYEVARKAMAQDVYPHTISSDLHRYGINGPVLDLATTMSKFLYLGLSLQQIIEMTTRRPAQVLGMGDEIGTLRPGACADVTLLELQEGPVQLSDAGWDVPVETVTAQRLLVPIGAVRAGELVFLHGRGHRYERGPHRGPELERAR